MTWQYKTPGIPDEQFERTTNVPITKEDVRVVQISKGRLCPGFTVYDIGCGSGSVSVEAALQVEKAGKVYAVDYDNEAVKLTEKNLAKFGITNVSVVFGNAKEELGGLPQADSVFIGGTGDDTADIVRMVQDKLRSGGRIVIGVILIETMYSVLKILEDNDAFSEVDITQVTISKSKRTSKGTMMLARNPVTVISATKS